MAIDPARRREFEGHWRVLPQLAPLKSGDVVEVLDGGEWVHVRIDIETETAVTLDDARVLSLGPATKLRFETDRSVG